MEVKPGYKQTEAGIIPEEWGVKPLRRVLTKGRLGGNYANQDRETEFPLMKMGNIARGNIDTAKVEYITPGVTPDRQHRLAYGDVLFNTRNTLDLVGKVAIWRDELPLAYYNSNLMRLEFDPQQVNSNEYANAALNTAGAISILRGLATGTTSVAAIYTRDLLKMPFIVPPSLEQTVIAGTLSDVDALLSALDQLIAKKRDLKQAAMQRLLTGQTRLPGFHGGWAVKTVAELEKLKLVKLSRGQVISKKNIEKTPGDFPIYSSSVHNNGLFGCYGEFMFDEELITWSVDGGGNFFHRPKHKFSVTNVCGFMRVDTSRISYRFFAAELQLLHSRKSFDYQSKSHPSVVRKEYEVQLPPLPEQTAIAEVLSDMDAELAALEQRRAKTRALKQGMMQELLTGRTRLI
jgi:type I restriction enzyme S subunit